MAISILGYTKINDNTADSSQSVTIPASTDLVLACICGWRNPANTITSFSLDGTSLTHIGTYNSASPAYNHTFAYYYKGSITGSKTLAWNHGNTFTEGGAKILVYCGGVDQTSPIVASQVLGAVNGTALVTWTSSTHTCSVDDVAVVMGSEYAPYDNIDIDINSQTSIFEDNTGYNAEKYAAAYKVATGTSIYTQMSGNYVGGLSVVLKPAATGGNRRRHALVIGA